MVFNWDAANIEHIARHGVTPDEVEEVVANRPFDLVRYIRQGEERLNQVGQTNTGRVLTVVVTFRGELVRVVTAYPANRELRAEYREMKKERDAEDASDSRLQD